MNKELDQNIRDLEKHIFWGVVFKKEQINEFAHLDKRFLLCLKVFYSLLFICLISMIMYDFHSYWNLKLTDPLWPLFFFKYLNFFPIVNFFLVLSTALTFLAIIRTESSFIRWLTFTSTFLLAALVNSSGKINHGWHLLLIGLFTVSLLKFNKVQNLKNTVYYLSGIFLILTTYFFAGFFKIRGAFYQFANENGGMFYRDCMSKLLDYQFKYQEPNYIAQLFFHQNELVGFCIYWVGILIEVSAVFLFFRIKNLQTIGVLLLGLHLGIALLLQVEFYYNIIVIVSLFILNPFKKKSAFYQFLNPDGADL